MRTYYIIVVAVLLIAVGLLMFPTVNIVANSTNTTGFLPLTRGATSALPYAFLGIVAYIIIMMIKK